MKKICLVDIRCNNNGNGEKFVHYMVNMTMPMPMIAIVHLIFGIYTNTPERKLKWKNSENEILEEK